MPENKKQIVAFDVNDTLVSKIPAIQEFNRNLLKLLKQAGYEIWVVAGYEPSEARKALFGSDIYTLIDKFYTKLNAPLDRYPDWVVDDSEYPVINAKLGIIHITASPHIRFGQDME